MEYNNKRTLIISSLVWKFLENIGVQGMQFIVQIILARLLIPEDYGIISIIMIFISISNIFISSGLPIALIRKEKVDEVDLSSVFYVSFFISIICYILIYMVSPYISLFYNEPILTSVLRVLSINLLLSAFNSIQNVIISRNMDFKKLFKTSIISSIISGITGIVLAYYHFGVWSLVFQQIINQVVNSIMLYLKVVRWRPKFIFSMSRLRELFSYGFKLLLASLLNVIYDNLRSIVIGKIYTTDILGLYNRGEQFPSIIVNNINGSIQTVMLPTFSKEKNNIKVLKNMVRRSITTSSFMIIPLMTILFINAENIVKILLTEKWLGCVPFVQIACIAYSLMPIHTANLQAINAIGRSDIFLKLEICKKSIGIIILVLTIPYGIYAIAIGGVISSIISSFLNSYPNLKLINYSYKEQISDILPYIILSLLMGLLMCMVGNILCLNPVFMIFIQSIIGILFYILFSYILKFESMLYVKNLLGDLKVSYKLNKK